MSRRPVEEAKLHRPGSRAKDRRPSDRRPSDRRKGHENQLTLLALPNQSPLIHFRFIFRAGSALDLKGREGCAALCAAMLVRGGSALRSAGQLSEALFPLGAHITEQVDKEMTAISGSTHRDNLPHFYAILREMLLQPGWRQDDFLRLREELQNTLQQALLHNDEELARLVLQKEIFAGRPYAHPPLGTLKGLASLKLPDVQDFYRQHFNRAGLTLGLTGDLPEGFAQQVLQDFRALPEGRSASLVLRPPLRRLQNRVTLVPRDTEGVTISMGLPCNVTRGHRDFPALYLATQAFGAHRSSLGLLFQKLREQRGLTYGAYSYLEYFPRPMSQLAPEPNLVRQQQLFELWVRPVAWENCHFALRLAWRELRLLVEQGLSEDCFYITQQHLLGTIPQLVATNDQALGAAIDARFYGLPGHDYAEQLRRAVASLTRSAVNRAVARHLRADRLQVVLVGPRLDELRTRLLADAPSPILYDSPKPSFVLEEDKIVAGWNLSLEPNQVRIESVAELFA